MTSAAALDMVRTGMRTMNLRAPVRVPRRLEHLDDATVIVAILAGSVAAETELFERYKRPIYTFIIHMIGDDGRSEDLLQETFVRVFRHLVNFDRTRKFSTWVFAIASNLAKNELRDRSRSRLVLFQTLRPTVEDDNRPLQLADKKSRPDEVVRKKHLRELVNESVAKLPEKHRQVFVLRELEGKPYDEIAEICECTLGTVKSRLFRARIAFAAIIGPMLD